MRIRPATLADVPEMLAIYTPYVTGTVISLEAEPPSLREFEARVSDALSRYAWLVHEDGGKILGYAYAGGHRSRAGYRWSVDVSAYVRQGSHRRGIGRALYEALFKEVANLGYYTAFAGITLPNDASVGLHEAMGFRPVGTYRNVAYKLGRWCDTVWFQRPLREPSGPPKEPLLPG